MKFKRLLAKGYTQGTTPPDSVFLPQHLKDVHEAALEVLRCTAEAQLVALRLDGVQYRRRFARIIVLAAAIHDLGKANDNFQEMVRRRSGRPQALRHEWVTYLLVSEPPLKEWLLPAVEQRPQDWEIALWCVTGHHPRYRRPSPPTMPTPAGGGSKMEVFAGHPDFCACLGWIAEVCEVKTPPQTSDCTWPVVGPANVFQRIHQLHKASCETWGEMNDPTRRLAAAAKACLIGVDVAGSAIPLVPGQEQARRAWVSKSLEHRPRQAQLASLVTERLGDTSLRPFQTAVAGAATRVTFVRAGCGTGKTIAAYTWAARNALCADRRLFVCYPTTGTATEAFRDYLFDAEANTGKYGAMLFHARRDVDLELLEIANDEPGDDAHQEALHRIASLEAWVTPIVSCTVDAVLGIVQNNRKGLYAWPALAQGAFVFDEIHAYDHRLFGTLLQFLAAMRGVPVLLMTASLPNARLAAIRACLAGFDPPEDLGEIAGPTDLENIPRYHHMRFRAQAELDHQVQAEVLRGGKVLWVCNTVERALSVVERMPHLNPHLYHSRFKYEDRAQRHREVVDAFYPKLHPGGALAVCTQVAEMSLDLSASLLVTDLAPVPSLVQRLGRLNRRATPGSEARPFVTVEPLNHQGQPMYLPYSDESIDLARQWLKNLGAGPYSQSDLARAWEAIDSAERISHVPSAWLEGGPETEVQELRQASPGLTVLLEEDADLVRTRRKRLIEVALSMPPPPRRPGMHWRTWKTFRGVPVAPAGSLTYDSERGARWVR